MTKSQNIGSEKIDIENEDQVNQYIREAAVAKLRSDSVPINDMSKRLNVHRTTVSRALDSTTQGRYEFTPRPPAGMDEKEFYSRLDEMLNQGWLRKTLRIIANDPSLMVDIAIERDSRRKLSEYGFTPRVGQLISRLIDRSKTYVGLTWGMGIRPYSDSMPGFVQRNSKMYEEPIKFVPLCGISESLEISLSRSSTVLAIRYHRIVNKGYEETAIRLYNLNSIPIMHRVFSEEIKETKNEKIGKEAIHNYIRDAHPDYAEIYGIKRGRKKPIIDEVDTILTSLGSDGMDLNENLDRWFKEDEIYISGKNSIPKAITKKEICNSVSVGDIAGIILPRPSESASEFEKNKQICESLNSYLSTLNSTHLKSCRERTLKSHIRYNKNKNASNNIPPAAGVVAIVYDENHIAPLLVALSEGYISRVVMDVRVERRLKTIVEKYVEKYRNTDETLLEKLENSDPGHILVEMVDMSIKSK